MGPVRRGGSALSVAARLPHNVGMEREGERSLATGIDVGESKAGGDGGYEPPGWRLELERKVARALRKMGLEVDGERMETLLEYVYELRRWNKAYNLVGRKLGDEGIAELIVDSLTPCAVRGLLGGGKDVLDIGTGAGMPAIPLYIVKGPFSVTLAEPQRKRITFLRHVIRKLGLQEVEIFPSRFEEMWGEENYLSAFDVVTARAVADPVKLPEKTKKLLADGGFLVLFVSARDLARLKRAVPQLEGKGMHLAAVRSTKRFVAKDHYLVLLRKEL